MEYAPVVIFAYNRVDRLKELLKSLEANYGTDKMELFIFVDVPNPQDKENIRYNDEVKTFVFNYKNRNTCFRRVRVIVAEEHKGLAKSIITGVTRIVNKYGKIIVLEDDLIVSNDFLDYMQRGLKFYKHNKRIWAITAHTPKMNILRWYKKDVFMVRRPESLGWATWKDRWTRTDWEVKTYGDFRKDLFGRYLFNMGGNDLCRMLKRQMEDEEYNSWAIRWGYQQFLERKYTIMPKESRVIHCGNDNRSTHGAFFSTQQIKKNYKKCVFENVGIDYLVLWSFRNVNSTSIFKSVLYWFFSIFKPLLC